MNEKKLPNSFEEFAKEGKMSLEEEFGSIEKVAKNLIAIFNLVEESGFNPEEIDGIFAFCEFAIKMGLIPENWQKLMSKRL